MKYFYKLNKPKSDLPMDEDRGLLYFHLVECPRCGKRGASVTHISNMDPGKSGTPELRRKWRELRRMSPEDSAAMWFPYESFARQLQLEFPDIFISPAMRFGTLQVRVDRMVDLCTPGLGVMVMKRSLLDSMISRGLNIESWPIKARFSKRIKIPEEIVELVAKPVASAVPGQGIQLCPICNRSNYDGRTEKLDFIPCKVSLASIPLGLDAFRIRECPLNVIVSERFVNALEGLDCGNVMWGEVQTD